jgi:hypothetical protein
MRDVNLTLFGDDQMLLVLGLRSLICGQRVTSRSNLGELETAIVTTPALQFMSRLLMHLNPIHCLIRSSAIQK